MSRLFGEAPVNRTAAWHPPPNERGSITILWTCLVTLTLCVWTAVHLNLPKHRPGPPRPNWDPRAWVTRQQIRKAGCLILGLLAPEFIAFIAWAQRRDAYRLHKAMQEAFAKPPTEPGRYDRDRSELPEGQIRRKWTIIHSFFALSGGFAFDTSELREDEKLLPGTRDRVTLSGEAVLYVAKHAPWLLPELSAESINDKSKANGIAKAIVCFQATWFLAETIVRLAQGLPISLLELNTFAHALCALLIYILWWDKPLDVEEPALLQGRAMRHICADLCHNSQLSGIRPPDIASPQPLRMMYPVQSPPSDVPRNALVDRLSNVPQNINYITVYHFYTKWNTSLGLEDTVFFIAFAVAGLVYGGLHLMAWNYPFPTPSQQLLWKISGLAVAGSGLVLIPAGILTGYVWTHAPAGSIREGFVAVAIYISGFLFAALYLFARGYLVVGCFLTFPYLPPEVFKQPEWSYYFPHIS